MVARVRVYWVETVVVAALVVVAVIPWRVVSGIPGARSEWTPWFLVQAVSPGLSARGYRVEVPTPSDVIRIGVLALVVLVAVCRTRGRAVTLTGLWNRLALSAGAGALGAAVATALTAPLVIPHLASGQWPTGALFTYVLMPPALHFGFFAGLVAGVARDPRRVGVSASGALVRAARIVSADRRNASMPSLADGPRRRSVFTRPPATSAAPWAAPDVSRTLCAAVRADPTFRRGVLGLLTGSRRRAVIPCPGVDLAPVLRHAVDAEQGERRRDLHQLAVGAGVLAGLFIASVAGAPEVWLLLVVVALAAAVTVEVEHHRTAERAIAAFHDAQAEGGGELPVPSTSSAALALALAESLAAIDRAQRGNVTVSAGMGPIQGQGDPVDGWTLTLALKPADRPVLPGLAVTGHAGGPASAFEDADLLAAVRDRLARLSPAGQDGGAPGFGLEERLFVNGGSLRGNEHLVPVIGEPVTLRLSQAQVSAIDREDPRVARCYLVYRRPSWNGHVVPVTLLRVRTEGGVLHVECVKMMERPVRARYRSLVTGGTGDGEPSTGFVLVRSVQTALPGMLGAPFRLLGQGLEAWQRRGVRRAEALDAYSERDFDYGGVDSVRSLASSGEGLTYYQEMDAKARLQLVDKTVLLTVTDFLEEHGLDTSELRTYQTLLLNQGIIQTGGVSTVGNQAVGTGAGVTGSRASVAGPGHGAG